MYTEREIHDARHEYEDIKAWFSENDFRVNKYVLGEYTDETQSWKAYKEERAIKLARIRELETIISLP